MVNLPVRLRIAADDFILSSPLANSNNHVEILLLGNAIDEPVVNGTVCDRRWTNLKQYEVSTDSIWRMALGWCGDPVHDNKERFARLPSGEMFLPSSSSSHVNL